MSKVDPSSAGRSVSCFVAKSFSTSTPFQKSVKYSSVESVLGHQSFFDHKSFFVHKSVLCRESVIATLVEIGDFAGLCYGSDSNLPDFGCIQ